VGNVGIHASFAANAAINQCDVLFSIGTRFNDRITGNTDDFAKNATLIHIDIDPASISRNIVVDIPIVADAKKAIEVLLKKAPRLDCLDWIKQIASWKELHPLAMKSEGLTPQVIINKINQLFTNSIVVTDVGQNQLWTTQFLELDENRQMLTSGGLGTMGYGFPAALGAKIGNPDKDVIVISGDGGIQMNIQELSTAVVHELPIIICIFNNGYLGNVRQWQQMFFQKRYASTCLRQRKCCATDCSNPHNDCPEYSPDFIKLAESYGAKGIRVTQAGEMDTAFQIARRNTSAPTMIEFIINREDNVLPMIPPGSSLAEMIMES
jgi:acetolactate synthase-1/2/3 large subunit